MHQLASSYSYLPRHLKRMKFLESTYLLQYQFLCPILNVFCSDINTIFVLQGQNQTLQHSSKTTGILQLEVSQNE